MSEYILPDNVVSPKSSWTLVKVLEDLGEWETSLAVGRWKNADDTVDGVLAIRWNGSEDYPIGSPQSRGLPTWFILPKGPKTRAILDTLPADNKALAQNFLPKDSGGIL